VLANCLGRRVGNLGRDLREPNQEKPLHLMHRTLLYDEIKPPLEQFPPDFRRQPCFLQQLPRRRVAVRLAGLQRTARSGPIRRWVSASTVVSNEEGGAVGVQQHEAGHLPYWFAAV